MTEFQTNINVGLLLISLYYVTGWDVAYTVLLKCWYGKF